MSLVSKEIKNRFEKYKLVSSFFLCLMPFSMIYHHINNRKSNRKSGSGIFVILHTMIINTVLFSIIFISFSQYLEIIFNKLQINISNKLLMIFISGFIVSCGCFVVGGIAHTIVLKKRNIPIRDWVSTDDLENEILCTGLITLFVVLILRMYDKLCSLISNGLQDKKLKQEVSIKPGQNITGIVLKKRLTNCSQSMFEGTVDQREMDLKLKKLRKGFFRIKVKLMDLSKLMYLSMKNFIQSGDPSLLEDKNMQKVNAGFIELQEQFLKVEDHLKDLMKKRNNLRTITDRGLLNQSIFELNKDYSICEDKRIIIECAINHIQLIYKLITIPVNDKGQLCCISEESITSLNNLLRINLESLANSDSEKYFSKMTATRFMI